MRGETLPVTRALLDVLRDIYEPQRRRRIWIDAICINQGDEKEKATQVKMMERIYKTAVNVLVWLGPSVENSDLAFDYASTVVEGCANISERYVDENRLPSFNLPSVTDPVWGAIGDSFGHRWFTRLWVIQEVVLASNVVVVCGTKRVAWSLLKKLAGEIVRVGLVATARGDRIRSPHRGDGFSAIESLDILRAHYGKNTAVLNPYLFLGVVSLGREKDVTEPVDRIYGLLGLADEGLKGCVKIDYSKENREQYWRTYIEFGKLWAKIDYRPLLSIASSKERPSELPSWCPNFDSDKSIAFSFGEVEGYKAGFVENKPALAKTSANSDRIEIRGFRMDRVKTVVKSSWSWSQFPSDTKGPEGLAAQLLTYESECLDLSKSARSPPEGILDAHWRTLIANNVTGTCPASADFYRSYCNAKRWWAALREQDPSSTALLGQKLGLNSETQRSMLTFMSALVSYRDRIFFCTVHGRTGLGPPGTAPGDKVCVFESAHPVFILRYASDSGVARLIGDAYVHGLMDLSLMPDQGREPDGVFVLG